MRRVRGRATGAASTLVQSGGTGMARSATAGMRQTIGQPVHHESLASIAVDWIAQHILDGTIPPGEKITEDWLASQMGISRSPVREALRELSRDGLVIFEPRRGARVGELDRKH